MERAYPTTQSLPLAQSLRSGDQGRPPQSQHRKISESVPSSINIGTNIRTVKLQVFFFFFLPKLTDDDQPGENSWLAVQLIIKRERGCVVIGLL